jgi:hypothetical protein
MLVNAIYIITESLGSEIQSVWRDVLLLLLKAASGQTCGNWEGFDEVIKRSNERVSRA